MFNPKVFDIAEVMVGLLLQNEQNDFPEPSHAFS